MQLNKRESIWLSILLATLVLVLGWVGLIRNQWVHLSRLTNSSNDLSTTADQLALKETELNQSLAKYRVLGDSTQKRIAYAFEDQHLEERMKGFINELSTLSTQTGNQLVAIRPYTQDENKRGMKSVQDRQTGEGIDEYDTALEGALKHFSVVKEEGIPLYSTEIELRIRGTYPQIKTFIEALSSIKSELIKIETLYLSYEALDNRTLLKGRRTSNSYRQSTYSDITQPMMMTSRLKFYLMEPGALNLTDINAKPQKKRKDPDAEGASKTEDKASSAQ